MRFQDRIVGRNTATRWTMKLFSILIALMLTAISGFAWGPEGHMMVAAIAWGKLKPEVRKEAARLLRQNPNYDSWTEGVEEADRDEIAFIFAATWPDEIKGDANYDNSEGNHPTLGAKSGQNIGYADMLQHRYWHFYDKPFSPDDTKLKQPDKVNALTQIVLFAKALKVSKDDSIRSYDLVWLLHLVGDIHQPLHATSRFDKQDPNGDEGGNRVHICSAAQMEKDPSKCRTVLHGYWDGTPGANKGPEAARTQAAKLPVADAAAARDLDPKKWINESFEIAQQRVYVDPVGVGDGPFVLTAAYRADAREVAKERVALAGARLAHLINQNLSSAE